MLSHKLHTTKSRIIEEDTRMNTDMTTKARTPSGRKHANRLKAEANREIALAKAAALKLEKRAESCCFLGVGRLLRSREAKGALESKED
jgi:hypothetical protein